MSEQSCKNGNHHWVCREYTGDSKEKSTDTPLTKTQTKLVQSDSQNAEVVCPGGIIMCTGTNHPMFPEQLVQTLPDLEKMNEQLIRGDK